jgi:hypothetical protein
VLTICCLLVKGPVPYSAEYVTRLERGARKWLERPFRFVCFTDGTVPLPPDIDTITIPPPSPAIPLNGRGYWSKLQVFNPAYGLAGRVLYLDLDTLVVGPLDDIVDFPAPLALAEDPFIESRADITTDRFGRTLVRRFNGSVMVWDAGTQNALWDKWSVIETFRLSTDQDWVGEQAPHARPLPLAWFPRLSQVQPPWPADARVVLCKKPKNHEAAAQWPWFERAWSGEE